MPQSTSIASIYFLKYRDLFEDEIYCKHECACACVCESNTLSILISMNMNMEHAFLWIFMDQHQRKSPRIKLYLNWYGYIMNHSYFRLPQHKHHRNHYLHSFPAFPRFHHFHESPLSDLFFFLYQERKKQILAQQYLCNVILSFDFKALYKTQNIFFVLVTTNNKYTWCVGNDTVCT